MKLHLKAVRDKYNVIDKSSNPRKYEVIEGSNKLVTDVVDLRKGRGKKKVLKQGNLNEVKYKHSSEPLRNCRIAV